MASKAGNKPGTIIAEASIDQLVELDAKRATKAVEQFWPAAVGVIIPLFGHVLAVGVRLVCAHQR